MRSGNSRAKACATPDAALGMVGRSVRIESHPITGDSCDCGDAIVIGVLPANGFPLGHNGKKYCRADVSFVGDEDFVYQRWIMIDEGGDA